MVRLAFPSDFNSYLLSNLVIFDKSSQQSQSIRITYNPKATGTNIHFTPDSSNIGWFDWAVMILIAAVSVYAVSYFFSNRRSSRDMEDQDGSYHTRYEDTRYRDQSSKGFYN